MKKTFKLLGIIALVAIIGFSMTACNQANDPAPPPPPPPPPPGPELPVVPANPLIGQWGFSDEILMLHANGNFQWFANEVMWRSGTWESTATSIILSGTWAIGFNLIGNNSVTLTIDHRVELWNRLP